MMAVVDKNRKGFAFLQFDDRRNEDAYINAQAATRLFPGDRVEVLMSGGEVQDLRIVEHRFKEIIGRYQPAAGGRGTVLYESKKSSEEVFIPLASKARTGEWVRVKLQFHEGGPRAVSGEVVEIYGMELPASSDLPRVAAEYGLVEHHTEDAKAEGRRASIGSEADWKASGRTDLRQVPFITIDGETARDFDDAVFVERKGNGYILWVGIADVSHYVSPGTALDREARARATSVYFPERAFHMLPSELSENLCSLKPHEPRLTMVARMEFGPGAQRTKTDIFEAVILSRRRATYNEIHAEELAHGKDPKWEYAAHYGLFRELKAMRSQRGSIEFELPEPDIVADAEGNVASIGRRTRNDAHKLIEEFMVAANESVAEWAIEQGIKLGMSEGWPFVYRLHDQPEEMALLRFQKLATVSGVNFPFKKGGVTPKAVADIARAIQGHPAEAMLNQQLLRSMKQAIYGTVNIGHFGLASRAYSHFTSPIRRYPDLLVHRVLRWALRVSKKVEKLPKPTDIKALAESLERDSEHSSYRERLATQAERDSIRLKQVRLMTRHVGEELEGKIIGLIERGIFVEIGSPYVEGMISVEDLKDDLYEFHEERMVLVGKRKKRTFKVGQPVKVRVLRADLERRQIDFELLS